MPELAVEMLGVVALDALPRAEAHVDRAPGREERRKGAHVRLRRAAAAEARGHARVAGFVEQALGAHRLEPVGDQRQRLVPGDRDEARILVAALVRVGALHRRSDAVRVVGLLHQPVGLDADLAAARMDVGGAEIGLDLGRDAVDDLDGQQVGPGDALVAVRRDARGAGRSWRRRDQTPALAALAASRASSSTSTTKRWCRPRQIVVDAVVRGDVQRHRAPGDRRDGDGDVDLHAHQRRRQMVDLDPRADAVLARIEMREQQVPARVISMSRTSIGVA